MSAVAEAVGRQHREDKDREISETRDGMGWSEMHGNGTTETHRQPRRHFRRRRSFVNPWPLHYAPYPQSFTAANAFPSQSFLLRTRVRTKLGSRLLARLLGPTAGAEERQQRSTATTGERKQRHTTKAWRQAGWGVGWQASQWQSSGWRTE